VGSVAEDVADDRAARPLNPDSIPHMHNVDHVWEPDERRTFAPLISERRRSDEVDHQDPARVPASRVPHCLP
jgi:hypothetical protein